jgi:hypothetical protein
MDTGSSLDKHGREYRLDNDHDEIDYLITISTGGTLISRLVVGGGGEARCWRIPSVNRLTCGVREIVSFRPFMLTFGLEGMAFRYGGMPSTWNTIAYRH